MSEKKVPELRFKAFSEDWEQRKLSELLIFSNGINAPKESYGKGRKMISVMDVLADEPITYERIRSSVEVDENVEKNNKVEYGDLVFVRSSEVINEVGLSKAYLDSEYALFSGFTIRGKKKAEFNPRFIELSLNVKTRKEIERKAGGSTRYNISQKILNSIHVLTPNLDEENKIGDFITKFDDTIALHQRKLEKLELLKKGFLQLTFPQKGENTPRLRFANFSEEWKQRKFEELWNKSLERNTDLLYSTEDVISVAKMQQSTKERNSTDKYMKTYNIIHYGDIAFEGNKSKNYSYGRFVVNDLKDGIVSHVFPVFRPVAPMDIDFMKEYINNETVMKHYLVNATTKTLMMTTLNVKDMNKQQLKVPSLAEQERIGTLFRKIDDTINILQERIKQINKLRKVYLQKLFV